MDFGWYSIFVEIVSSGSPSEGSKFLCFVMVPGEYVEVDLLAGFGMQIEKYLFYILKTDEYLSRSNYLLEGERMIWEAF
ncbi:hypothetical protein IMY05_010G0115500 [Salix suchowensis]|nr:hypothetical protein IMY05_010G0115500 [Salix suchowensis]